MDTTHPHDDRRRTVLCIKTPRSDALPLKALSAYDCYVVHDTRTASRKAQLGAFDLYLGLDADASNALIDAWRTIRTFDRNTPFLFVLRRRPPLALEAAFLSGIDDAQTCAAGPAAIRDAIARLLALAEERSLDARREEMLAIREDIRERMARLESRIKLSRESVARAQEHVVRAYAMKSFTRLGGTRTYFERYWVDAYEEALEEALGSDLVSPPR